MKQSIIILFVFIASSLSGIGQEDSLIYSVSNTVNSTDSFKNKATTQPIGSPNTIQLQSQPKKPELFNSGFLDFQNSGQLNASARVFKLYIGEPKKFMLPISVYSGVSGNNYNTANAASNRSSEQMVLGIINPMSGLFNISTENTLPFLKNKESLTGFSIVYQVGEKMLSGLNAFNFKPYSFFSTYANSGLLFQTGAWEKDKEKNMGVFWLLFRYHAVQISNSFQKLSGYPPDKEFFKGFSIGMGIEINNVLNIKSYYYRYINPGTTDFEIPIYQLTFNYSMKSQ